MTEHKLLEPCLCPCCGSGNVHNTTIGIFEERGNKICISCSCQWKEESRNTRSTGDAQILIEGLEEVSKNNCYCGCNSVGDFALTAYEASKGKGVVG